MKQPSGKLAIFGAGGHGKVVADAAIAAGWRSVVFFDGGWTEPRGHAMWSVEGRWDDLLGRVPEFDGVVVAIGACEPRLQKTQALLTLDAPVVSIVHPRATVSAWAKIGPGSVVFAGAVVNIDASLGLACIVNTGATIDHDCQLADGVHVAPGAHMSGNVAVGSCAWVGVGAAVRQGITIGDRAMVGAGAVVVTDVSAGQTVVGCPAKPLAKME